MTDHTMKASWRTDDLLLADEIFDIEDVLIYGEGPTYQLIGSKANLIHDSHTSDNYGTATKQSTYSGEVTQ